MAALARLRAENKNSISAAGFTRVWICHRTDIALKVPDSPATLDGFPAQTHRTQQFFDSLEPQELPL